MINKLFELKKVDKNQLKMIKEKLTHTCNQFSKPPVVNWVERSQNRQTKATHVQFREPAPHQQAVSSSFQPQSTFQQPNFNTRRQRKQRSMPFSEQCSKCGRTHNFGSCPAFNKQCRRCLNYNHFAALCRNRPVDQQQSTQTTKSSESECSCRQQREWRRRWVCPSGTPKRRSEEDPDCCRGTTNFVHNWYWFYVEYIRRV